MCQCRNQLFLRVQSAYLSTRNKAMRHEYVNMHLFRAVLGLLFLVCALYGISVFGGELSDFEQDVVKGEEHHSQKGGVNTRDRLSSSLEYEDDCVSFGDCVFGIFIEIFSDVFVVLERESMAWVRGDGGSLGRQAGDVMLPVARVGFFHQNLQHDVEANKVNLEFGYGTWAIAMSETQYQEKQPNDELTLKDIYGLYRLTITPNFGVGLGIGYQELIGKQRTSGSLFTIPIEMKAGGVWGIGFQGKWANLDGSPIEAYDFSIARHFPYSSVMVGYEHLSSENESLHGPYIGLSLQW